MCNRHHGNMCCSFSIGWLFAVVLGTYDYMSKNYASVSIFYGQMSYERIEESKTYTPFDLIGKYVCGDT